MVGCGDGTPAVQIRTFSRPLGTASAPPAGHLNERGQPFNPGSVKAMLEGGR
jgi:hypothetical protein